MGVGGTLIMHLFRCPDCGREHDAPAEATFVLAVVCFDCALVDERSARPAVALDDRFVEAA